MRATVSATVRERPWTSTEMHQLSRVMKSSFKRQSNPSVAHIRIDDWLRWQSHITRAALAGPVAVGSTFSWEAAGLKIVSVIDAIAEPQRILWHGEANGILGIHVWAFSPEQRGTLVVTEESWEGLTLPSDVSERSTIH